jgi:hypothetical protein
MSNNKGFLKLAVKTFLTDLQTCEDYQRYKNESLHVERYDNDTHRTHFITYGVDDLNTKENRELNRKALKKTK